VFELLETPLLTLVISLVIKRVIATGGDTVDIHGGHVYVSGTQLTSQANQTAVSTGSTAPSTAS
jgi:signal peptidase I